MIPLALLMLLAPPARLSCDRFANVFVAPEPVRVKVAAGEAVTAVLTGLDGPERARREVAAGTATVVEFGVLPPGYYEVAAGGEKLPLAVMVDPAKRVPGDSRLATDNAMSWLVKPEHFEPLADVLKACGVGWVRERLSWGEIERERGKYTWGGRYDAAVKALSSRGIKVYNIFHATPGWARADHEGRAAPDDLRDIYRFTQELARHYRGQIQAWEVWNEPDIDFFRDTAAECAALQKAAFLGFRSVDPGVLVLGPSMAYGLGPFSEHLLANGTGQYLDVWNFHIYADPADYPARCRAYREVLARHRVPRPSWVTEAGSQGLRAPGGLISLSQKQMQASHLARGYAEALNAGVDMLYWFVFPFYREHEVITFGLFDPQLRAPWPGLAAMSAATYACGQGRSLGMVKDIAKDVRAYAFDRGDGTAAVVVWREGQQPGEVALPLQAAQVREAIDTYGSPVTLPAGAIKLSLGRSPVYLILPAAQLAGVLTSPVPSTGSGQAPAPSPIVARLRLPGVPFRKDADYLLAPTGVTVPAQVELYNFGAQPAELALTFTAPNGVQVTAPAAPTTVAAGERVTVSCPVVVADSFRRGELALAVRDARTGQTAAPAVLSLGVDLNAVKPVRELALGLDTPDKWQRNIAGHGQMTVDAGADGGVAFGFSFTGEGDPWAYPRVQFDPVRDLREYDAVRFEYRTSLADAGWVRLMLGEPNGALYIGPGLTGSTTWRRATIPFSELQHLSISPADANGRLDLDQIASLLLGANCRTKQLKLEVRNLRVIRLAAP